MSDETQDTASMGKDAQAQEQALEWFTLMQSGVCSKEDIAAHKTWMQSCELFEREYRSLEQMWQQVGTYIDKPEILKCRQRLKTVGPQKARQGNIKLHQEITHLQQKSTRLQQLSARLQQEAQDELASSTSTQGPARFFPSRYALAASLLVVILSSGLVFQSGWIQAVWNQMFNESIYQTGVGEQKTFYLSDGSSVILDTNTAITTNFSDNMRNVVLSRGQAHFNVARDQHRPFVVHAGNGVTTAIGTAFIVKKGEENILVTLIEGKVAVAQQMPDSGNKRATAGNVQRKNQSSPTPQYHEVMLEAGQQVAYSDQGLSSTQAVDVERATAWQQGRLIFEDYSLREVLNELNRYSHKKIVLGDNSLASIRVTGVFKSGDNHKAIRALKTYFSMRVTTDLQGNLVLLQKLPETDVN